MIRSDYSIIILNYQSYCHGIGVALHAGEQSGAGWLRFWLFNN
jgi:hypothetical protein